MFRRANPASTGWNVFKTSLQIVVFWGFFLFALPPVLTRWADQLGVPRIEVPGARMASVVVFAAASLVGLASAYVMASRGRGTPLPLDAPRELVVSGPYAFVRNPMALAGVLQGLAVSLWNGSIVLAGFFVGGGLIWHVFVRPTEERDLASLFGAPFENYRRAVPLWLPRATAYLSASLPNRPPAQL